VARSLFSLGQIVATPGALAALEESSEMPWSFLRRHLSGDWGSVCHQDKAANRHALVTGERLLSAYHTSRGVKLWIITEADRSSTCLLLPDEY
jgi:hypothetical protein